MKTRSKPKATKEAPVVKQEIVIQSLEQDDNPPRLFVLPKSISHEATIVTLAHPRTLKPTKYYMCPKSGIYEFKRVAAKNTGYNSWLLQASTIGAQPSQIRSGEGQATQEKQTPGPLKGSSIESGYSLPAAEILTATSIDPLFILMPAISPKPSPTKLEEPKSLFLSADDLLESLFDESRHFREVVQCSNLRALLERRMAAVCDHVDAGGENMYRLNTQKLVKEILRKAEKVVSNGIPRSMEAKFINKPLEMPMLSVKRDVSSLSDDAKEKAPVPEDSTDSKDENTQTSETVESQSSTATPASLESQQSVNTTITIPDESAQDSISGELLDSQRMRVALEFIISSYLPPHLATSLNQILGSAESPVDFKALDAHIAEVNRLKAEAATQRSLSDFTRKRGLDDDEAAMDRAEKKRKQEEDEKKKKANESRGIKDLKKVNVSGMKKMSDFFKKAPPKAASKGK